MIYTKIDSNPHSLDLFNKSNAALDNLFIF